VTGATALAAPMLTGTVDLVCLDGRRDALERRTNAFADDFGHRKIARHDRGEFLPTEPADDIVRAHAAVQELCEDAQGGIADGMSEPIVDRLEVMEIEHHQRHRCVPQILPRRQRHGIGEEGAPVE
jgi:hypothetical protein